MTLPIYLDTTLQKKLEPVARSRGKGIGEVVNDILKNQVELLTTLNPTKRPKPLQPRRSAAKPRRVPSARQKRSPRRG